jgi:hypothetical protein
MPEKSFERQDTVQERAYYLRSVQKLGKIVRRLHASTARLLSGWTATNNLRLSTVFQASLWAAGLSL